MSRRTFKARSADGPMMFPALEMHYPESQRITHDEFAVRMLEPPVRMTVRAMAWRPLRNLLARTLDRQLPGLWGGMVARKRYADDQVAEALAAGITQVVILGAGFDTRSFRLIAPAGALAFEVDLPENSTPKRMILERMFGEVPERVALVPVDFENEDLAVSLAAYGFRADVPTMYVLEAVTQYLTADAIDRLFAVLSRAPASSRLIFTYVKREFLDGTEVDGWEKAYQKWVVEDDFWSFGLYPAEVGDFLARYGWIVREHVGTNEYRARYFEPARRALPAIDIERFVMAEKAIGAC